MTITHGGNLFAIADQHGWPWHEVLDLSASINPLGPSPAVRPAIEAALDRIAYYPGEMSTRLEGALAAHWHVAPDQVLAGAGAAALAHFVARTGWSGPTAFVTPVWSEFQRAFPHARRFDLNAPDSWPQRGLLIVGQPVNPTGEAVPEELLRRAVAGREGPVLIDESFIEFTRLESAVTWTERHPNLIVLRSLSKFYALPGLRVGALVCSPEWAARLNRHRAPWPIGTLAEAAALAALADTAHAERTRALVDEERAWLLEQLAPLTGLRVLPGEANFLFAYVDRPAAEVCAWFLERKIILRDCAGLAGVTGEAIRFAVRARAENERFLSAAREFFCAG